MKRIYVLHPGKIRGFAGIEYFDAHELAEAYGLEIEECVIYNPIVKLADSDDVKYVHLRPRGDGNYKLG